MPARSTFFVLYREAPFRVYFNSYGFDQPRRDETRLLRTFKSTAEADFLRKNLSPEGRKITLIGKRSVIKPRMKSECVNG